MSTQIDPLTGLPMVFDNIIEQIPLDAQIFPYADLGATARPTAPPLYPDSIIPVSAFLSGQHPDTGSAQTVMTNGDHDLRVHVTNAASGGGSAPIITPKRYTNTTSGTDSSPRAIMSSFGPVNAIWAFGFQFLYRPQTDLGAAERDAPFFFSITPPNQFGPDFFISQNAVLYSDPDINMHQVSVSDNLYFPLGIDPSLALNIPDKIYDLVIYPNLTGWDLQFQILYT